MTERVVKIPGPNHPITIEPNPGRVIVTLDGRVIADTRAALTLYEAGYLPVQYVAFTLELQTAERHTSVRVSAQK
jgi:uncharacterized protein (DUF427 family)